MKYNYNLLFLNDKISFCTFGFRKSEVAGIRILSVYTWCSKRVCSDKVHLKGSKNTL